jgi:Fic family protein
VDIDKLRESPVGSLVRITGTDSHGRDYDHFAFVPDPLPDQVHLDQLTWSAVTRAAVSIGELRQACANLPNPQLLITPALAKEAQATSALEGTYGTLPDVLEARLPGFEPRTPEIREIHGYERMARQGFDWVRERPITVGMLCELQRTLAETSIIRPPDPGRVREHQVAIGSEDRPVAEARFVPPPGGDALRADMQAWQDWINRDDQLDVIVRAALAHYQFETLHPFSDGNGRIGRLVIVLQLLQHGLLESPSLTISPWFLRRRQEYQDKLLHVSTTGDWDSWVRFFAQAITDQCNAHVGVARQLRDWMSDLQRQIHLRDDGPQLPPRLRRPTRDGSC